MKTLNVYQLRPELIEYILKLIILIRINIYTFKFMIAALLLSLLALSQTQLLGIDLGTMYSKVAMVQPGAGLSFSILQNTKSERKIQTALSFSKGQRFYESDAISKRTKSVQSSFVYTKMFIDLLQSPQEFKQLSKDYFLKHKIQNDGNLINFILEQGFKDKITISIEQVFGMIFKHIKHLAEKITPKNVKVRDCVLTVPFDWTLQQRIILLNALLIADLNPLYIVTENTAAAVHYGVNRDSNSTHKVLFYNLGANYLEMSVAEFRKPNATKKGSDQIYILGSYGAHNVGGLKFDLLIKNRLQKIYQEKYKKELSEKGQVRLLSQSMKVKQILSANKEVHVAMEELDGVDFHTIIRRTEFESDSQSLLSQITDPIIPFLKSLDLSQQDVKFVELIGGSIRMPKLQQIIGNIMKPVEVGTHINGDEAMAFGSAFLAANSSKKYKVKGLHLYDGWNFDVIANIRNLDQDVEEDDEKYINKTVKVFKQGQRFGLIKDLILKARDNVAVQFFADYGEQKQIIKRIQIKNVTGYKSRYPDASPKLLLSVRTNSINIIDLVDAKLAIVKDEQVGYFQKVKKQEKTDLKSKEKKSKDEKNNESVENSQSNSTNKTNNSTSNDDNDKYQTVRKTRMVQKTHNLKLITVEYWKLPALLDDKQLQQNRKILYKFQKFESDQRKLAEAKNKLQSAIYEAQELIEANWFKQYSTDDEIDKLKKEIEINQEKIYQALQTEVFNQLYKSFYKNIEKVKIRRNEEQERQRVKTRIDSDIADYKKKFQKLVEDSTWLTDSDKQPFTKILSEVQSQLQQSYKSLEKSQKTNDPPILNKQLLKLVDKVKQQFMKVSQIRKPKKTEKKQKKQKSEDDYVDEL